MRKLFSIVLALTVILSCIGLPVSAATTDPSASTYGESSDYTLNCPRCGAQGDMISDWYEYNYYYTRYWNTLECPRCGNRWNTVIWEMENPHSSKMDPTEAAQ